MRQTITDSGRAGYKLVIIDGLPVSVEVFPFDYLDMTEAKKMVDEFFGKLPAGHQLARESQYRAVVVKE